MIADTGDHECQHCGLDGLRWQWYRGRFQLFNGADELHDCEAGRRARRREYLRRHPELAAAARIRREGVARLAREW